MQKTFCKENKNAYKNATKCISTIYDALYRSVDKSSIQKWGVCKSINNLPYTRVRSIYVKHEC